MKFLSIQLLKRVLWEINTMSALLILREYEEDEITGDVTEERGKLVC